jgi:ribosomal protein S12 methylthiotransferase accessory factor
VSAVVIADRENGTFGVKFGCHPSFPISVERTLTEALQGKRVQMFTVMNAIGTPKQVDNYDNFPNTTKTGEGFYPAAFLGATPSWRYRPWTQWESADNREYLKKLLALIRRMGYAPLFRDASHLGFPTYWIVVPGISELFDVSRLRLRDGSSTVNSRRAFHHFPRLTPEEEENLLRLILFKEGSILENSLSNISGLYLKGDLLTSDRVGACLALKHGRYPDAARLFRNAAAACRDGKEQHYLRCLSEYARLLHAGASREDALSALTLIFGEEPARRAELETADPDAILEMMFPQLTCYDCDRCPAAGIHCEYPAAREILKKLNQAMERSTVSQQALLENLKMLI